jgi:hypothetical protein
MISFMYLGRFGRLGNQLFEIATTISTAIDYKQTYIFNNWKYNKFLKNPIPEGRNKSVRSYTEQEFHYVPINLDTNFNWDLKGWFQSEKYFKNNEEAIRWHFQLSEEYDTYIRNKYKFLNNKKTCSIHVRRGDFLELPEYHTVIEIDYYVNAIKKLYGGGYDDITFVVCSDDIEWCKENLNDMLPNITLEYIEDEEDIIDMFIMSYCGDNIMACSSFSWWAAWLNENVNKKVIAPTKWFGEAYKDKDTSDLIPGKWTKIN